MNLHLSPNEKEGRQEVISPGVLVHGGAGTWPEGRVSKGVAACEEAADRGAAAIGRGAVAAVVEAVKALEENPLFNAGIGATLTREGTVELDAALMTGDLRFGAIAACPPLASGIEAALRVYDEDEHAILSGAAAGLFAAARGVSHVSQDTLITPRTSRTFDEVQTRISSGMSWKEALSTPIKFSEDDQIDVASVSGGETGGTVGAVAVDQSGTLAAATSTGGIIYKRLGRIGDTPLPGAGTYADDFAGGAASATGHGESILRVLLCREAVQALAEGDSVEAAVTRALAVLDKRTEGKAGLILIDRDGNAHAGYNTRAMPWALCRNGSNVQSGF